eukprot:766944-Hanusia_phi.AAC.2
MMILTLTSSSERFCGNRLRLNMPRTSRYQDTIDEDREYDEEYRAATPDTVDENMDMLQKNQSNRTIRDLSTFEMTVNHSKILILISKYAQCALAADDSESWLRQLPLQVMVHNLPVVFATFDKLSKIYEGISAGVLDFDYSPMSVFVGFDGSSRRIYINISQEGRSAVEDLLDQKLLNGMKISTEE